MSEQKETPAILLVKVSNGWAVYPGAGVFDYANGRVSLPIAVFEAPAGLVRYVESWALEKAQ